MKVVCVIPAYNEERNIKKVIEDVRPYVNEIVIVDDCSSDATYKQARILENNNERSMNVHYCQTDKTKITVLQHPINRGQGAALQTGNEYALSQGADIIVHFDADGQFLADEIQEFLHPLMADEADVILGSRFLGKKSNIPFTKANIILPLAKIINKMVMKTELTDPQNGFRAMAAKVARQLKIEQDQMAHCSEILYKIFQNNYRIKEVPVTVVYHDYGQGFTGGIKIIKDLVIRGWLTK